MQKLIKLSDEHYIIVNDSEIKESDYFLWKDEIHKFHSDYGYGMKTWTNYDKKDDSSLIVNWSNYRGNITHSTEPLENGLGKSINGTYPTKYLRFDKIKQLSISEVEEAIYGYSVENMAYEWLYKDETENKAKQGYPLKPMEYGYIKGFKAHQEIVKDKLFTSSFLLELVPKVLEKQKELNDSDFNDWYNSDFLKMLFPKTEWNIEFDEQGKIRLI